MKRKNAFTLIELLVVIAIIALLLSVIAPALKVAKESAKTLRCTSNMRQMAMAFSYYATENNGKQFVFDYNKNYWFRVIAPFLGDRDFQNDPTGYEGKLQINICPSTKVVKEGGYGAYNETWGFAAMDGKTVYGSYGLNAWVLPDPVRGGTTMYARWGGSDADAKGKYFGENYASVRGSVPLLVDSFWVDAWPFSEDTMSTTYQDLLTPTYLAHQKGSFMRRFTVDRHRQAINAGFVDGHAEKVDIVKLWTLQWNNDFATRTDIVLPRK